jgi:hypothetical protein
MPYLKKNKGIIRPALHYPDIRPDIWYPALPDIRLNIKLTNLVSGRILDIKKGRIILPDILPFL